KRMTSADLQSRWRLLSGNQGRASDPEFSHFAASMLDVPIFDTEKIGHFRQLLACLARGLAGEGDPHELLAEIRAREAELRSLRVPNRAWVMASEMVDIRIWRGHFSRHHDVTQAELGLTGFPQNIAVGLLISRDPDVDGVEDLIARDSF